MKIYQFGKENGKSVTAFHSDFILSRIIETNKKSIINFMCLEQKGIIGYHQAVVPQLFLVIYGEGSVRSEKDEYVQVQAGDAVFWNKGEWHETKTDTGLHAIVIESEVLDPSFMVLKE